MVCTFFRSKSIRCSVIVDGRRIGKMADSSLTQWKTRLKPVIAPQKHQCFVCHRLEVSGRTDEHMEVSTRNPYVNLKLCNIVISSDFVQDLFGSEMGCRSGLSSSDAMELVAKVTEARLCTFHHNQSRHSQDMVEKKLLERNGIGDLGEFGLSKHYSCPPIFYILRPLPG